MSRKGYVFYDHIFCGELIEGESGYVFSYDPSYLSKAESQPISLTMPLQKESFVSSNLFPFFDGLLPEGWLLDLAVKNWKLNYSDRFGLLLKTCQDPIGAVSVEGEREASSHA